MKIILKTVGLIVISTNLILTTGCNSPTEGAGVGAGLGALVGAGIGAAADSHNRAVGALIGAGAGAFTGAIVGGVMGEINEQQRAQLQQQSPQTLATIQHNDEIAQQQQQQTSSQPQPTQQSAQEQVAPQSQQTTSSQPPSTQPSPTPAQDNTPTPLTVDDIKALTAAGVKPDVIKQEIAESKASYTQADIDAAQQANPPIDPTVIAYMKNPTT